MIIRESVKSDLKKANVILASHGLPLVEQKQGSFWVAEELGEVIAVGGIQLENQIGLVRSIAVHNGYQAKGIGKAIYDTIEKHALGKQILRLFLLTTTAEQFFLRQGYEAIERGLAPIPITTTDQFAGLCPESAVLMQKSFSKVQGRSKFDSGLYCAESVLTVVANHYNVQSDFIPGIATGLCSGMGRTCGTCGALTGGILAVNLIHGRKTADDSVDRSYAAVQGLIKQFTELYGTTNCAELLNCDLGTASGQQKFTSQKLHRRCREYTGMAADLSINEIEKIKKT